jgi:probable phosphomutase (TIGR03848 family)
MPILLLIRHGANDYSKRGLLAGRLPEVHLNEAGQEQALALAQSLGGLPIKAVYTSPLERARETAEPLGRELGLKVRVDAGLVETDVGRWQGKSIRRLAMTNNWRIVQRSPSRAAHPGGESFMATQTRVVSALDAICLEFKLADLVACVFHSDPIKLAVAHYIGLPLDHFQRLVCDPASVTMLHVAPASAHLVWLNRQPPFALSMKKARRNP